MQISKGAEPVNLSFKSRHNALLLGVILVLLIQLIRIAWIDEDAFITFKVVLNFVAGEGPVWNIGERVQVFTHPLWFMLLSIMKLLGFGLIKASIFISVVFVIIAVVMLLSLNRNTMVNVFLFLVVICSKAFMEYSTSGLENSLSALLLGVMCFLTLRNDEMVRNRLFLLTLIMSLVALNRLDLILLGGPALLYCFFQYGRSGSGSGGWSKHREIVLLGVVASLPLFIWHVFSLIYYGYVFPNSYYAKLETGIPQLELVYQGIEYFRDSMFADPVTLLSIAVGLFFMFRSKSNQARAWAVGVILYLLYILKIGGGYMSGRFFMLPLLVALFGLASTLKFTALTGAVVVIVVVILGLVSPTPILLNDTRSIHYKNGDLGISNERAVWYSSNGFLAPGLPLRYTEKLMSAWDVKPVQNVLRLDAVGGMGLVLGTENHVVDVWAIVDPYLSHLPLAKGMEWHIGHFRRKIPEGYLQSIRTGENHISDPGLAKLYENVRLLSRGEIWSKERWLAIWDMNSGNYREFTLGYDNVAVPIARDRYASVYKNDYVIKMLKARNSAAWVELDRLRGGASQITRDQNQIELDLRK